MVGVCHRQGKGGEIAKANSYVMTEEKKEEGKEKATETIRVSKKLKSFLYTIANEVRMMTGRRSTPDEILTANKQNITTKTVLEMRKREDEKKREKASGAGGADDEKKVNKTLLDVAFEDRERREKREKD